MESDRNQRETSRTLNDTALRILRRPSSLRRPRQRLGDLVADRMHRIERRHGFLEDHADAVAAQCTQALRRCPQQIFAFKEYPTCAGLDLAGRKEPQYRPGHHGLARAGLPDHTQDLVARQAELQILHGMAAVSRRRQTNAQTVDL